MKPGAVVKNRTLNEVMVLTVELNGVYVSACHHTSECVAHLIP